MAKSKGESRPGPKTRSRSRRLSSLIPGGLIIALLAGLGTWYFLVNFSSQVVAAEYKGGPRLAVDRDLVDFGHVHFKNLVTARFHLRNVGDQPLVLAVDPRVEAIEGC